MALDTLDINICPNCYTLSWDYDWYNCTNCWYREGDENFPLSIPNIWELTSIGTSIAIEWRDFQKWDNLWLFTLWNIRWMCAILDIKDFWNRKEFKISIWESVIKINIHKNSFFNYRSKVNTQNRRWKWYRYEVVKYPPQKIIDFLENVLQRKFKY